MSTYQRLRAVSRLAIFSAVAWGLLAVVVNFIVASAFEGGHWDPTIPFLVFGFLGLIAGAVFAVGLGLKRPVGEAVELSAGRATAFGGIGGGVVFLLLAVFGPGEFEGATIASVISIAAAFSAVGALTGLAVERVAKRGALPPSTDTPKSIAP